MPVKGLDRLNRQIAALPQLMLQAASDALAQGADELKAAISRNAPHGASGDLAASVDWAWANDALAGAPEPVSERAQAQRARRVALGELKLALVVSAGNEKAYYARWVEFGTSYHPAKKPPPAGQAHYATPQQPFFWPVIRAYKTRVKSRVVRNANKAAKAAAQVT